MKITIKNYINSCCLTFGISYSWKPERVFEIHFLYWIIYIQWGRFSFRRIKRDNDMKYCGNCGWYKENKQRNTSTVKEEALTPAGKELSDWFLKQLWCNSDPNYPDKVCDNWKHDRKKERDRRSI